MEDNRNKENLKKTKKRNILI